MPVSHFSARPSVLVIALLLMLWPATASHSQATSYAHLVSVSANPTSVTGGTSCVGTVTVGSTAPSSAPISLFSSDPAVQVPSGVTVDGTKTSATFPITTTAVSTPVTATITASETFTSGNATNIIEYTPR